MSQPEISRQTADAIEMVRSTVSQAFTPEQIDALRQQLEASEERVARLKQVSLGNGDQPAPGFRPYRKEERSR